MNAKYNPGKWFQGKEVIKKKTRKIKYDHFPKLPHVQQLIKFFENLHNVMRVTEVWFLRKKDTGDGFEEFHYDYNNIGGGSNDVSFTVNVNLGKWIDANDIATMNVSIEEKIKLSSVICRLLSVVCRPTNVLRSCVRNSYLSTSATNQYEYEDEIDNDNNENDKDDKN